jgi:hypothetical protein
MKDHLKDCLVDKSFATLIDKIKLIKKTNEVIPNCKTTLSVLNRVMTSVTTPGMAITKATIVLI